MFRLGVLQRSLIQRGYSSAATKQPSPTSRFYGTFSRPIAKTLLLAVFTYQLTYWSWAKLEADDIRASDQETISRLEGQVRSLAEASKSA
ncbi:hypothetical protein GQ602_004780 [Ophiocordyceps camponoti-floridani]|uniref:Inner membrane assembly complex subunit 17 n=1 Tax=Ophiocordyceps camponoti-floridani TaxID=2030778 RepID=A0A8H4Q4S7_9HYPO|nr:hypothetical protein GQ602_004780 [Ophiocordyceps camponoti-floridani]